MKAQCLLNSALNVVEFRFISKIFIAEHQEPKFFLWVLVFFVSFPISLSPPPLQVSLDLVSQPCQLIFPFCIPDRETSKAPSLRQRLLSTSSFAYKSSLLSLLALREFL